MLGSSELSVFPPFLKYSLIINMTCSDCTAVLNDLAIEIATEKSVR